MNRRLLGWTTTACALALWSHTAWAQFSSGSTGADGAFSPVANQNLNVKLGGVYHYTTVNIPAGITINYFRNADNAPLVILATGDVTISGTLAVIAGNGNASSGTGPLLGGAGGPGGFNGGMSGFATGGFIPTAGMGPGGGQPTSGSGGQSGVYGAPSLFTGLVPLFGGSGGGGGVGFFSGGSPSSGSSGAGGGGGILIASTTRITVNGAIRANGGLATGSGASFCSPMGGAGSGGTIRLVAPTIQGFGSTSILQALGGSGGGTGCPAIANGGPGRIRLEAAAFNFQGITDPTPSIVNAPGPVSPGGNPALANVPTLAIASIGGIAIPANPAALYSVPDVSLPLGTTNPVPVVVNATNTPVGGSTVISVRLIPRQPGTGSTVEISSTDHSGTPASSTATANISLTAGQVTLIQAWASMTLSGQTAMLFPLIDGEPVERVMTAATPGQASTLSLVTRSGKERRVDQLPAEDQTRVALAWEVMRAMRAE